MASKGPLNTLSFFQPNYSEFLGVPESKASLLIGFLSIASTLSRFFFGLVLNHPRVNRFCVFQVCIEMFFFFDYGDYAYSSLVYTYESKITSVMMPRKILV